MALKVIPLYRQWLLEFFKKKIFFLFFFQNNHVFTQRSILQEVIFWGFGFRQRYLPSSVINLLLLWWVTYNSAQRYLAGEYQMEQLGTSWHIGVNPKCIAKWDQWRGSTSCDSNGLGTCIVLFVLKRWCIYFYFALDIYFVIWLYSAVWMHNYYELPKCWNIVE